MLKKSTGIHFTGKELSLIELSITGKSINVADFSSIPFKVDETSKNLKTAMTGRETLPRSAVFGLPVGKYVTRESEFPFYDKKRVGQALPFSIAESLPYPIKEASIASYAPLKLEGKARVVSFVAKKEVIEKFSAQFSSTGIRLEALTTESAALTLALSPPKDSEDKPYMIVHFAPQATILNITDRERAIFSRSLSPGISEIAELAADQLSISKAELLSMLPGIIKGDVSENKKEAAATITGWFEGIASEVNLAIRSYGSKHERPKQIIISGNAPSIEEVVSFLEEKTGCNSGRAHIKEDIKTTDSGLRDRLLADGVLALGLALSGINGRGVSFLAKKMPLADNLLVRTISEHRRPVAIGAAVLTLLYTAGLGASLHSEKGRYEALKSESRRIFSETLPEVKRIVNEKHQMQTALDELERRASYQAGGSSAKVIEALKEVNELPAEGLSFRITRFRISGGELKLEGEAPSFDGVEKLKTSLSKSSIFKSVDVAGAKASRLQDVVIFQLNIRLK